jgi:hypothetical protein
MRFTIYLHIIYVSCDSCHHNIISWITVDISLLADIICIELILGAKCVVITIISLFLISGLTIFAHIRGLHCYENNIVQNQLQLLNMPSSHLCHFVAALTILNVALLFSPHLFPFLNKSTSPLESWSCCCSLCCYNCCTQDTHKGN